MVGGEMAVVSRWWSWVSWSWSWCWCRCGVGAGGDAVDGVVREKRKKVGRDGKRELFILLPSGAKRTIGGV
jgi:hypothetical protein